VQQCVTRAVLNESTLMEIIALTGEKRLLEKIATGDEQAFAVLFNHYCHPIGEHLFRLTRSMEMAEEIVQDVFLKIWIAREALSAINALKKLAREKEKFRHFEASSEHNGEDSQVKEIEEQYYSLLDEAIDRLPAQQKKVFILSRRQRKKYEEIAEEMNLSRESVKKYLQHATRSISEYVREHMDPSLVALLLLSECQLHQFTGVLLFL